MAVLLLTPKLTAMDARRSILIYCSALQEESEALGISLYLLKMRSKSSE